MICSKDQVLKKLAAYDEEVGQRFNTKTKINKWKNYPNNLASQNDIHLIPAAVLVLLINRTGGITVLLTRRNKNLNRHAGQISFPGGRSDAGDRDAQDTALRETEEEIGLTAKQIEIVGQLNEYAVGTGYLIRPIIGFTTPPLELTAHPEEVDEIFEAPLSFVINPNNFGRHTRETNGKQHEYFSVQWNDYLIWGATAEILRDLSQRLWDDQ